MLIKPRQSALGRVLVVDDESDACRLTAEAVLSQGYEAVAVKSGFEAMDQLSREDFDIVLLDVRMEGMDGFETLRRIRAMEGRPYIPVILLTALSSSHRDFGIKLGADDFLTKPFRLDDLLARVKVGMRLKRLHERLFKEKEKVAALYRIAKALNAAEDIRAVAEVITSDVKTAFEADFADFLLVENGAIEPILNRGFATSAEGGFVDFERIRSVAQMIGESQPASDEILIPVMRGAGVEGALFLRRESGLFGQERRSAASELALLIGAVLERCKARQTLSTAEKRFRQVVENAAEAFFFMSHKGDIDPLNGRCAELLKTLDGKLITNMEEATSKAEFRDLMGRLNASDGTARAEIALLDGKVLSISAAPVEIRASKPEFLCSALDVTEAITQAKELNRERELLAERVSLLSAELSDRFGNVTIIGRSEAMQSVFSMIDRISNTTATVLITGETGTGKELVARAIHYSSPVKDAPFVKVDCGALSVNLLESELFGHVKGSFTSAIKDRAGRFELAKGGTIFLDEIGNLPIEVQTKLLRVLQDGQYEPVGSTRVLRSNARVIAATNSDLNRAVARGEFRSDLFYRLNVVSIPIPPLRERRQDIPLLANSFVEQFATVHKRLSVKLSDTAVRALTNYSWPGNVRELRNVIEQAVILARGTHIEPKDLKIAVAPAEDEHQIDLQTLKTALAAPEKDLLVSKLKANKWNCSLTADELGVSRTTLYNKMKKFGIRPPRVGRHREKAGRQ